MNDERTDEEKKDDFAVRISKAIQTYLEFHGAPYKGGAYGLIRGDGSEGSIEFRQNYVFEGHPFTLTLQWGSGQ